MEKEEMRFLRREIINRLLHAGFTNIRFLSYLVRRKEIELYQGELKAYA